jgi:hypothetical protein
MLIHFLLCLLALAAAETVLVVLAVVLVYNAARLVRPAWQDLCYWLAYHLARLVVWLARQDSKTVDFTVK